MQTPHDRWLEPRDDEEWPDEENESTEPDPEPEEDEYECY